MNMTVLHRALLGTALVTMLIPSIANAGPFDGWYDEDTAKSAQPAGQQFHQTLFSEYRKLSSSRDGWADGIDAELFNHKALLASTRTAVREDSVWDRHLSDDQRNVFTAAKVRLENVFDAGGRELAPVETGTAQVSYDCWIEATERKSQSDSQGCKNKFEQAIAAAEAKSHYKLGQVDIPAPPPVPAAPPPVVHSKPFKDYYRVHFNFDKTSLVPESESVLSQAIHDAEVHSDLKISLRAHADRSGSDSYNMALSRRRAEAILARMAAAGISQDRLVIVQAVGESRPLVPTPDGVKNVENRTVEIDLRQYD